MKKIKKYIAYLLSIFVLMGSYKPVQAEPTLTEYVTEEGIEYAIDTNNEIVITGYSGSSSSLIIPDSIDGKIVTSIGNEAFFEDKEIITVEFPKSLKNIGRMAFGGCEKLETIEFPQNLEWIGACAFQMCYSLKKVIIYENTELEDGDIGNRVFSSYASGFKMYGYKDSPAETYAKKWNDPFVYNDWIPLTDITLPEEITVNINERTEISVLYGPEDSYVGFRTIDERSFTGTAMAQFEYGENGTLYITGTKVGQNELYITKNKVYNYIDDHIVSNVCKVTIVDPGQVDTKTITIKGNNDNILNDSTIEYDTYESGYTHTITLETEPFNANEEIIFTSSKETIAKVNKESNGYILKLGSGYFQTPQIITITATGKRSGITATFNVSVFYGGADSITFNTSFINDKNGKVNKITNGEEYNMPLVVVPADLTSDAVISISNQPKVTGNEVITYNQSTGLLKAVGVGTATITAECKGESVSYNFEVIPYEKKATSVTISTNENVLKTDNGYTLAMDINDTYKLNATVLPSDTTDIFKWSAVVNNGVISIDNQGNITAIKVGTATIKASSCSYLEEIVLNAESEYLKITVTDPNAVEEPEIVEIPASDFTLNNVNTNMDIGETLQLNPVITPSNSTDKVIFKTNDSNVATVTSTGFVTAVGPGTTWVSGTVKGMWQGIKVTIEQEEQVVRPTVTLSQTSLSMKKGEVKQLIASTGVNTLSPQWSSQNVSILNVTSNGIITANSAGTALVTVTAYSNDHSLSTTATCLVTITEDTTPPTDTGNTDNGGGSQPTEEQREPGVIKLNATKFNLQKGKTTKALKIKSSTYSDDPIVSVISSNSKIVKASFKGSTISLKGVKASNKYVTIKIKTKSGATATSKVKVVKSKVSTSKLKLNKKNVTLKKGKSETLTVTQTPISATDKLTWTSSNKKVATVNKNGKIVAKKKGSTVITLKSSNGKKVTCKVKVK
jgi:uncharacterized protein YjdB